MKLAIFFSLILTHQTFAKSPLLLDTFNKVRDLNQVANLKVYSSHRFVVTYEKTLEQKEEINREGAFNTGLTKDVYREIIPANVVGKIIGISANEEKLFVSFDSQCLKAECSYIFGLAKNDRYYLEKAPSYLDYQLTAMRTGLFNLTNIQDSLPVVHLKINKTSQKVVTTKKNVRTGFKTSEASAEEASAEEVSAETNSEPTSEPSSETPSETNP